MAVAKKTAARPRQTKHDPVKHAPGKQDQVQGEGDYVSARKYNERTRAFVDRMGAGAVSRPSGKAPGPEALRAAEKQALARSKGRAGDRADARAMQSHVVAARAKRGPATRKAGRA